MVRSLGDTSSDIEDEKDAKLNESLLEDGVSLKTEEAISEEVKEETSFENKSPEKSGTE